MPEDYRPEGADKLIPERESAFDPKKRRMYHLDRNKSVVWEDVPEGFKFDKDGQLQPVEPKEQPAAAEGVKIDG